MNETAKTIIEALNTGDVEFREIVLRETIYRPQICEIFFGEIDGQVVVGAPCGIIADSTSYLTFSFSTTVNNVSFFRLVFIRVLSYSFVLAKNGSSTFFKLN